MTNLSNSVHTFTAVATDSSGHTGSSQVVFGTTGNDAIMSSAANQILYGNGGSDTFAFSSNIGRATIADFQASNDVVQLSHSAFSDFADVLAHAVQAGSDVTISVDPSDSITLHGTALSQLTANNFHLV
jgi:Ca2+-binding RTX toxin-like protein